MSRPSRLRRWLKWAGLVVSLLIAVAWGVSLLGDAAYQMRDHDIMLHSGALWIVPIANGFPGFVWQPSLDLTWWWWSRPFGAMPAVCIPLWIPFLLILIPTAVLRWLDRRCIPPGHCRSCGYDLTGNVSGVCPECGEKVRAGTAPKG